MVEELENVGIVKDLYTINGSVLNATSLKKMGLIQAIGTAPKPDPNVRTRRGPVLDEFELFFQNELPEVKVHYLNVLKQNGSVDNKMRTSRQKLPSTKDGIVEEFLEAASQKERRTKCKQDVPSVGKEKSTEENVAEEKTEAVVEEENKNDEKEAEKRKKRKKSDKMDDETNDEKDAEEEKKEAEKKRAIALGKLKADHEKKKRKRLEADSERSHKKLKGG
ncbi:uncharacterized protein LOC131613491 [Vicia villosa]|uniref:uncharacterized protein LOC131613491 n=1 Tax=Vicia villosa TaxID=3911 RepID=UPI00273AC9D3|nr:uncharacterized protein LOC131613491 [Vicia villosa]